MRSWAAAFRRGRPGAVGPAEAFAAFLRQHVWSSAASSPGLASAPQTRILNLVPGGDSSRGVGYSIGPRSAKAPDWSRGSPAIMRGR